MGEVKPCWDSMFAGIRCLEMEEKYGFFKSRNDKRPSSCLWISKKEGMQWLNDYDLWYKEFFSVLSSSPRSSRYYDMRNAWLSGKIGEKFVQRNCAYFRL